jgi:hypothetical protein
MWVFSPEFPFIAGEHPNGLQNWRQNISLQARSRLGGVFAVASNQELQAMD